MERTKGEVRLLVSLKDAAKLLSLSERTVWTMAHTGAVPHVRIKRRLLFSPLALQAWIDAQQQSSAVDASGEAP